MLCTTRHRVHSAASHGYLPSDVARLYSFPTVDATGHKIAVIELGGGYRLQDVQQFCLMSHLPVPPIHSVSVLGATNAPTGDPQGPDGEVALDIDVIIGATLGTAPIDVYFAPNTGAGFATAVAQAAQDPTVCAVSISWGQAEIEWSQADMLLMEKSLQACRAAGIAVFAASGDNGSTDGEPGNTVDYPAASPFAIGCGGTTIVNAMPLIESAWSSGGGGYSAKFARPAWQTITGQLPGRGVPDVAGDANPSSGYIVVVDGKTSVIGGTSAVAPLWAGLTALLCAATGRRFGNLAELLYSLTPNPLHDITTGSNGGYRAGNGWDAATGLGSPNGSMLLSVLSGVTPPQPTPTPVPGPAPIPPAPPVPPPTSPVTPCEELLDILLNQIARRMDQRQARREKSQTP